MEIEIISLTHNIQKMIIAEKRNNNGKLTGEIELELETEDPFMRAIDRLIENNTAHIILDMTYVTFLDSAGMWAIFEAYKKTSEKEGSFVIINLLSDIERIFKITRVSKYIYITKSEADAIKFILEKNIPKKISPHYKP
jgi:anti-sigma B factor antagonist